MELKPALIALRQAIADNDEIDLTDEELREMASLCARELRSRLTLDAVRNGDLPESHEDAAKARRVLYGQIVEAPIFAP